MTPASKSMVNARKEQVEFNPPNFAAEIAHDVGIEALWEEEPSKNWISYSFAVDPKAPNFVSSRIKLFNFTLEGDDDIEVTQWEHATVQFYSGKSFSNISDQVSESMQLDVSWGAFSGAVSELGNSLIDTSHRQLMAIHSTKVEQVIVHNNAVERSRRFRPAVRDFIDRSTAEQIHLRFGEFIPQRITLGGVLRSTFQQTMTETDSVTHFETSVQAGYKAFTTSAEASGGTQITNSATYSSEDLHVSVEVQGGDVEKWLQHADFDAIQNEWAKTFTINNTFPVSLVLIPIWDLITEVNVTKAAELEAIIKGKWRMDAAKMRHQDALEPKAGTYWKLGAAGWDCVQTCNNVSSHGMDCSPIALIKLGSSDLETNVAIFKDAGLEVACRDYYFDDDPTYPQFCHTTNWHYEGCWYHKGSSAPTCDGTVDGNCYRVCPCTSK